MAGTLARVIGPFRDANEREPSGSLFYGVRLPLWRGGVTLGGFKAEGHCRAADAGANLITGLLVDAGGDF